MADAIVTLELPEDLAERYDRLAGLSGHTGNYHMAEALTRSIDRLEYEYGILKDIEDYRAGRLETVMLEELEEDLGLRRPDRGAPRAPSEP